MSAPEATSRAPSRATLVAALVLLAYALVVAFNYLDGARAARRGEVPLFTDFTPFYAASLQLAREPAENLYVPDARRQAEVDAAQAAYGGALSPRQANAVGFSAWMHPPLFMLFCLPLAALPYLPALLFWLGVTALPLVAAVRTILAAPGERLWVLAAPPVFFNLMYGQTGFLSGGLIGLGLANLTRRPTLAGLCIGLASVKPHLGVLIPLALVLGGHWKPFGVATLTVCGLFVASLLTLGADPWYAYIGSLQFYAEGFAAGAYELTAMNNTYSLLSLAGAPPALAWTAQKLAAAVATTAVAWAWYGPTDARQDGLRNAILCCATALALPMVYLYDLVLLVPALAWLWRDLAGHGARAGERHLLWGAGGALLALYPLARLLSLQAGPLVVGALLALGLVRLRAARRAAGIA